MLRSRKLATGAIGVEPFPYFDLSAMTCSIPLSSSAADGVRPDLGEVRLFMTAVIAFGLICGICDPSSLFASSSLAG